MFIDTVPSSSINCLWQTKNASNVIFKTFLRLQIEPFPAKIIKPKLRHEYGCVWILQQGGEKRALLFFQTLLDYTRLPDPTRQSAIGLFVITRSMLGPVICVVPNYSLGRKECILRPDGNHSQATVLFSPTMLCAVFVSTRALPCRRKKLSNMVSAQARRVFTSSVLYLYPVLSVYVHA